MNLKQLEYFVRVAEIGSFSRASAQLGVAQPALSKQVRELEVELRQNLLIRNGRGALPTEAGKRLLEHGRGILHQVALAKEDLSAARSELAGHVSIGLPPSLSRLLTVSLTQAFCAELPLAQLTLTEGFSVQMLGDLRMGKLDLALLYNPATSVDLEHTLLIEESLMLFSASHANSGVQGTCRLQDVSRLPLILPSRPNAFRQLIDHEMARLGVKANIVVEVDGLNAILSLVQIGLGHAVLPRYTLAQEDKARFAVRAITQPQLISQLVSVIPSQRPTTLTQQKAKRLLHRVVRQALG